MINITNPSTAANKTIVAVFSDDRPPLGVGGTDKTLTTVSSSLCFFKRKKSFESSKFPLIINAQKDAKLWVTKINIWV